MMLGKARCRNVEPVNADFLTVDPKDTQYVATTHMFVPSPHGNPRNKLNHALTAFWTPRAAALAL